MLRSAALVLFVIVGGMVLTSFNNMAMLFWGLKFYRCPLRIGSSRKESLLSNEPLLNTF